MGFSFVHKSRVVDDSYEQPATNLNAVTKNCKTTENEKLQTKASQRRRTENPLPRTENLAGKSKTEVIPETKSKVDDYKATEVTNLHAVTVNCKTTQSQDSETEISQTRPLARTVDPERQSKIEAIHASKSKVKKAPKKESKDYITYEVRIDEDDYDDVFAGDPHAALLCENDEGYFDGVWERVRPNVYRHYELITERKEKLWLYQIKNRWVIGTSPGWNQFFVDFYRLKVHSDPLDKKEKYSPDLTPDKMQWYSTETMEKFDMNFYQLIIVDEDDQIKNRS